MVIDTRALYRCPKGASQLRKAARQAERARERACREGRGGGHEELGRPGLAPSTLIDANGLGYGALAADCAALGVPTLDGAAAVTECLERQHACRVEQILESRTPRLHELLDLGQLPLP